MSVLRRACSSALIGAVATAVLVLVPAGPSSAATSLTVLGPLVTLKSGDPTPVGAASASVTTARNEFESFQVVVTADAGGIGSLAVDLAGDLTGSNGNVLGASAFTIYRESYFTVGADHRTDGESSAGGWPDALVPQVDPIYGQARSAFSAAIPGSGRAVLWVDVLAGQDQTPDTYTGTLRVKDGATVVGTVPVSVTVRNIELPSTSSLTNVFPTEPVNICRAHTGTDGCNGSAAEANRLSAVYARSALENRVTLATPWQVDRPTNLDGAMLTNWRTLVRPIINGTTASAAVGSPIRLPGARSTALVLWHHCKAVCIDTWKAEATAGGFADRLHYYTCDEPGQSAGNWTNCNANHAVVQAKGLRELVTAPLPFAHDIGGSAETWIDDMVVHAKFVAGKVGAFTGNQRPGYTTWEAAAGDGQANKVWIYDACDAGGCHDKPGDAGWDAPLYDGWSNYGIDQPASQARAMSWVAFAYDAAGELYWNLDYRLSDAWKTCGAGGTGCLFESGMNGDGTLFYPGKACAPGTGLGCIGGTTDIPIESIRLKRIRDGREDYEYLKLAAGDPATAALADSTALGLLGGDLATATFSTTFSQAALDAARDILGDAIEEPYEPPAASFSIGDAIVTEGTGGDVIASFPVTGAGDGYGYAEVRAHPLSAGAADYELLDTSFEMSTADTEQIRVRIIGDAVDEPTETFQLELWNNTAVGLGDAFATGTILDDDPPPTPTARYRPDGEVRLGAGAYRGNGFYNTTGVGQTIQVRAQRGVTKTFYVRIGNDGNVVDNWSLAEVRSGVAGLSRTWWYAGRNVTTGVAQGTFSLLNVPAKGTRVLRFTVRPTRNARFGQVATWALHAVHNPLADRIRDVVRIQVRVVR